MAGRTVRLPLPATVPPAPGVFTRAFHAVTDPLGSVTTRSGFMMRPARHLEAEHTPRQKPVGRPRKRRRQKPPLPSASPLPRTSDHGRGGAGPSSKDSWERE